MRSVNCWTGDFGATPGMDLRDSGHRPERVKIFFEVNDTVPYVGAQLGTEKAFRTDAQPIIVMMGCASVRTNRHG